MISLLIVDSSAESRKQLVDEVNACFLIDSSHLHFLPRISLKPVSPEELRFCAVPDICIVGPTLLLKDLNELGRIRRQFPKSAILVRSNGALENISMIEHLARLGADDILTEGAAPIELLRKIVLHARSTARTKSGTLITIDSGKGGLGVTSIAAALAELSVSAGKKTAVVDFDTETQDLSRFLQVRPFINDNLNSLLTQQKPMVQELVEECFYQVWADEDKLFCLPPAPECDAGDDSRSAVYRTLVSFFEILDSLFDVVIVDRGSARGVLKKTLHRISDHLLLVHGNDPASLYATVECAKNSFAALSPASHLWLLQNAPAKHGLPKSLLSQELKRATRLQQQSILKTIVPFSASGASWPGSGGTLASRSGRACRRALRAAVLEASLFHSEAQTSDAGLLAQLLKPFRRPSGPAQRVRDGSIVELPAPPDIEPTGPSDAASVRRLPAPHEVDAQRAAAPRKPRELLGKAQVMQ